MIFINIFSVYEQYQKKLGPISGDISSISGSDSENSDNEEFVSRKIDRYQNCNLIGKKRTFINVKSVKK